MVHGATGPEIYDDEAIITSPDVIGEDFISKSKVGIWRRDLQLDDT